MKTHTAWLVTNHCPDEIYSGYDTIKSEDTIIAIDGGLEHLIARNITPDLIIGDFDSLRDPAVLNRFPSDIIYPHPAEKNETDTELAIDWCIQNSITQIVVCNDLGGRTDHVLALIQNLLKAHIHGIKARVESSNQVGFFLDFDTTLDYPTGSVLSLISISEESMLLGSIGLKYTLENLSLKNSQSRGISNLISASPACIFLRSGTVFCLISNF